MGDHDVTTNGEATKRALLALVGDRIIEVEILTELLIEKGIISAAELDAATEARYTAPFVPSPDDVARTHMDPEDGHAIDDFFGDAGP